MKSIHSDSRDSLLKEVESSVDFREIYFEEEDRAARFVSGDEKDCVFLFGFSVFETDNTPKIWWLKFRIEENKEPAFVSRLDTLDVWDYLNDDFKEFLMFRPEICN